VAFDLCLSDPAGSGSLHRLVGVAVVFIERVRLTVASCPSRLSSSHHSNTPSLHHSVSLPSAVSHLLSPIYEPLTTDYSHRLITEY